MMILINLLFFMEELKRNLNVLLGVKLLIMMNMRKKKKNIINIYFLILVMELLKTLDV